VRLLVRAGKAWNDFLKLCDLGGGAGGVERPFPPVPGQASRQASQVAALRAAKSESPRSPALRRCLFPNYSVASGRGDRNRSGGEESKKTLPETRDTLTSSWLRYQSAAGLLLLGGQSISNVT